ncbi:MAG: hypothetical protein J6A28_01690 [Clostridia bacterium]|nr:hypothetical protein [Clostridia bacterium]
MKEKRIINDETILYNNEKAYLKDSMKQTNKIMQAKEKMVVLKEFFLWVFKNRYDVNNVCVLVEYEKYLQHKKKEVR